MTVTCTDRSPWLETQITLFRSCFILEAMEKLGNGDLAEPAPEPLPSIIEAALCEAATQVQCSCFSDFEDFIDSLGQNIIKQTLDQFFQTHMGQLLLASRFLLLPPPSGVRRFPRPSVLLHVPSLPRSGQFV